MNLHASETFPLIRKTFSVCHIYTQTYFMATLLRIAFQPFNKRMNVSSKKLTNLNQSWNTGKSEMDVSTDLCSCSLIQKCYKKL